MFYNVPIPLPNTPPATASCPRCGFALLVIPRGEAAPAFDLRLGELLEHLRNAQDALTAARTAVAELEVGP